MADIVLVLILVLLFGFMATRLAQSFRLPHSVFLVIIGIIAGGILKAYDVQMPASMTGSFSDIILFILLPPLVFESAYQLQFSDLKKNLSPILGLAIFGLILSTALVGGGLHLVFGLGLLPSLVFGALISATDPVAVVALFKEVGAPRRLTTLVEGESLFNDGTAIVLFRVLIAATLAPTLDSSVITNGISEFFAVTLGGIGTGIVVAILTSFVLKLTAKSGVAQLGITVAAAYVSFLVADHTLHVSGIFATLTVGMVLGNRARLQLNKEALHGMHYVWGFLALCANTIVFLAVGITCDYEVLILSIHYIPVTLLIVYSARVLAVLSTTFSVNKLKLSRPINFSYQAILIWGGLRGGLALALVLMLPENFPHKQLFITLTMSVVLSTLLINALTLSKIIHFLKIDKLDDIHEGFYFKTLDVLRMDVFRPLQQAVTSGILSKSLVSRYAHRVLQPLKKHPTPDTELKFQLHQLLYNEQNYYDNRLEDGLLSKKAYVALTHSIQERLELLHHSTRQIFQDYSFQFSENGDVINRFIDGLLKPRHESQKMNALRLEVEILIHLDLALQFSVKKLDAGFADHLGNRWILRVKKQLEAVYMNYPNLTMAIQSRFILDSVNSNARHHLDNLLESDVINASVHSRAKNKINKVYSKWMEETQGYVNPNTTHLLAHIPFFRPVSEDDLENLASSSEKLRFQSGTAIKDYGKDFEGLYIVSSGIIEISGPFLPARTKTPRLYCGDFFLNISFLQPTPRSPNTFLETNGFNLLFNSPDCKIEALSECEIIKVPVAGLMPLIQDNSRSKNLLANLVEQILPGGAIDDVAS